MLTPYNAGIARNWATFPKTVKANLFVSAAVQRVIGKGKTDAATEMLVVPTAGRATQLPIEDVWLSSEKRKR